MTALLGQYTHRLSNYACHSKWAQASFLLITFLMLKENVIDIRAVESKSLKVGKSLKIGKNRIKSEKLDLISYPSFCKNAKMP